MAPSLALSGTDVNSLVETFRQYYERVSSLKAVIQSRSLNAPHETPANDLQLSQLSRKLGAFAELLIRLTDLVSEALPNTEHETAEKMRSVTEDVSNLVERIDRILPQLESGHSSDGPWVMDYARMSLIVRNVETDMKRIHTDIQ